jgi:hypothetical protein
MLNDVGIWAFPRPCGRGRVCTVRIQLTALKGLLAPLRSALRPSLAFESPGYPPVGLARLHFAQGLVQLVKTRGITAFTRDPLSPLTRCQLTVGLAMCACGVSIGWCEFLFR